MKFEDLVRQMFQANQVKELELAAKEFQLKNQATSQELQKKQFEVESLRNNVPDLKKRITELEGMLISFLGERGEIHEAFTELVKREVEINQKEMSHTIEYQRLLAEKQSWAIEKLKLREDTPQSEEEAMPDEKDASKKPKELVNGPSTEEAIERAIEKTLRPTVEITRQPKTEKVIDSAIEKAIQKTIGKPPLAKKLGDKEEELDLLSSATKDRLSIEVTQGITTSLEAGKTTASPETVDNTTTSLSKETIDLPFVPGPLPIADQAAFDKWDFPVSIESMEHDLVNLLRSREYMRGWFECVTWMSQAGYTYTGGGPEMED